MMILKKVFEGLGRLCLHLCVAQSFSLHGLKTKLDVIIRTSWHKKNIGLIRITRHANKYWWGQSTLAQFGHHLLPFSKEGGRTDCQNRHCWGKKKQDTVAQKIFFLTTTYCGISCCSVTSSHQKCIKFKDLTNYKLLINHLVLKMSELGKYTDHNFAKPKLDCLFTSTYFVWPITSNPKIIYLLS